LLRKEATPHTAFPIPPFTFDTSGFDVVFSLMSSFTLLDDPTESTALSKSKGNECFSEKLYEDAIFHYTDAIDSFEKAGTSNDPYLSLLYNNRATSFANIKKHGRAINDAKKAIKLDSANPKFFWRLSASLSAIGNFAAAKTQAEAGLKLNPENIPLLKLQRDSKRKIKEASVSANARAAKEIKGTKPAKSIDLGGLYGDKGGKHASSREIIAQLKVRMRLVSCLWRHQTTGNRDTNNEE